MAAKPNENHEQPPAPVNKTPQKDPRQPAETDRIRSQIHMISSQNKPNTSNNNPAKSLRILLHTNYTRAKPSVYSKLDSKTSSAVGALPDDH